MPEKIDLKKRYKSLFTAKSAPALIDVPALSYLMVDGADAPSGTQFENAVGALYSVAYSIKFGRKKAGQGPDYGVPPLEALWWSDDPAGFDLIARPETARWTAMILQPDFVAGEDVGAGVAAARLKLAEKRQPDNPALDSLRLETLAGERAAQLLHVGAYSDEQPTIERLHAFIADEGLSPIGRHHEIYLNDPGRTPPEKLKTILRQPVA